MKLTCLDNGLAFWKARSGAGAESWLESRRGRRPVCPHVRGPVCSEQPPAFPAGRAPLVLLKRTPQFSLASPFPHPCALWLGGCGPLPWFKAGRVTGPGQSAAAFGQGEKKMRKGGQTSILEGILPP